MNKKIVTAIVTSGLVLTIATSAFAFGIVKYGSTGNMVKTIQYELDKYGYGLAQDGIFGPATLNAVKNFQSKNGLVADGIVGPLTEAQLEGMHFSGLLHYGMIGGQVRLLQYDLSKLGYNVAQDGYFGPATLKAVKNFQTNNGLKADGIVGSATQNKIEALLKGTSQNKNKPFIDKVVSLAGQGKVINSDAVAGKTTIDDVKKVLGEPQKQDYVASAKGTYATYTNNNVTFGFNKGSQIFEIRSYNIKTLTLEEIEGVMGKPAYDKTFNGQKIIGYVVNPSYKIEFVFKQVTKDNPNPALDHYNVLYPRGTVNYMANDPGRAW